MEFLADLHRYTYRQLDAELIWPASMPAGLDGNDSVAIADNGSSNVGYMKHVYRRGLDLRYGRIMQSIAGIHYTVSLPDELCQPLRERDGDKESTLYDYLSRRSVELIR